MVKDNYSMKKATKAWMIVCIVLASISFVFCLGFGLYVYQEFETLSDTPEAMIATIPILAMAIGFLIASGVCIIPIIINSIGLKVYANAERRRHLVAIAVLLIIFGNPVSGILMLCHKDDDLW